MQDVDLTGVELINVDADTDANTARQYNVRAIPTLILLDETGEEIKRKSGGFTLGELNKFLSVWR
jgi:thioredoxin-like negative regulator of GroEL